MWFAIPAGVLAAHAIGYVLAYRNAQYRADVLAATGHGYLGHIAIAAIIAGAIAVSAAVARGVREHHATRFWDATLRIAVVQLAAFFGVEVLERIAAGVPPFAGFAHVALIGAIVELLMGGAVAAVLIAFEGAGRTIASVERSETEPRRGPRDVVVPVSAHPIARRFIRLPDAARAPPQLLAST
jgi:hypothetical protein